MPPAGGEEFDDLPTEAIPPIGPPPLRGGGAASPDGVGPGDDELWMDSVVDSVPPPPEPGPPPDPLQPPPPPPAGPPTGPPDGPVPPGPGGDDGNGSGGRRLGVIVGVAAGAAALAGLVIGLVVAGGGDDAAAPTTSIPTTSVEPTTSIPTTTSIEPTTTVEPTTTLEPTTTVEPTTTTEAPSAWPQGTRLYVAGADGVHLVEDRADDLVAAEQVALAVALPNGDLLVQDRTGRRDRVTGAEHPAAATAIRRIGRTSGLVLAPEGEQWISLHDVGTVGGSTVVLVGISERAGSGFDEELFLVPLGGGPRQSIGVVAQGDAQTSRLHLGGGGIVGEVIVGSRTGPLLLDTAGAPLVDPAVLGLRSSYDGCGRRCPHLFAIDPSGTSIGWIEDGALAVVDASNGRRLADIVLDDEVASGADSLELVLGVAVIGRRDTAGRPLPAVVVDLFTRQSIVVTVPGPVTAQRS
jgi:hypothetical protein